MIKNLLFIVLTSLFFMACRPSEQFFVARYGMINDVYKNGDHISTTSKDGQTVITIELRNKQFLLLTVESSFDELKRKDLKTAEMVINRPNGNKPLALTYLKKIKLSSGKLTKEIYIDAQFSYGRDHIGVQGRFPIKLKK